jgi:hypothetical protein
MLPGSAWLGGQGVDVCANGSPPTNVWGYHDTDGVPDGEMWQCVELVVRLYLTRGWISRAWLGNGDTIASPANVPPGLVEQDNGSITYLNPGDAVSLADPTTGSGYDDGGHAAVVDEVSGSTVYLVNQNALTVYSQATWIDGTLTLDGTWQTAGYRVIAVVHAPVGSSTAPVVG